MRLILISSSTLFVTIGCDIGLPLSNTINGLHKLYKIIYKHFGS